MRISRSGESLWTEWTGDGIETEDPDGVHFVTDGHVSLDNDIVLRALASALQRDGSADGLGGAYKLLELPVVTQGWAGALPGELDYVVCDKSGETYFGDQVEAVIPMTWVEIVR